MKIAIITVGTLKKGYIKTGVDEYASRLARYVPVEFVEVRDETGSVKMPRRDVLRREGERLKAKLGKGDFVVALTDKGKAMTTEDFARFVERTLSSGKRRICFVVGGAYGLDEDLIASADLKLSLSAMTMPHELARLVISEQLYRAFTIMRGEPYSH